MYQAFDSNTGEVISPPEHSEKDVEDWCIENSIDYEDICIMDVG